MPAHVRPKVRSVRTFKSDTKKIFAENPVGFLRMKLIRLELPDDLKQTQNDPHCAVNVKERVRVDGQPRLQQKKKTFHPSWNQCFDTHTYEGRVMQVCVRF